MPTGADSARLAGQDQLTHMKRAAPRRSRATGDAPDGSRNDGRDASGEALDRSRFLAEAATVLAASLDQTRALQTLARLAVPKLADWCLIYLLDEEGRIRRVAMEAASPDDSALTDRIEGFSLEADAPRGVPAVIRSGAPELHPEADAALLAADVSEPERLEAVLRPLGIRSWMCVPLSARGHTFGAISMVASRSGRTYGPGDLAFAEDLAHRAGLALDNARLFLQVQEAERRFRVLVQEVDAVVWEADPEEERFLFVSPRAEGVLGYPPERWLEPGFLDAIAHPNDGAVVGSFFRAHEPSAGPIQLEFRVVARDGTSRWLRSLGRAEHEPEGRPRLIRGLMLDVTEAKAMEVTRETGLDIARAFRDQHAPDAVATRLLQILCARLGWDSGVLWNAHGDRLRCEGFWPDEGELAEFARACREATPARGEALPGMVWEGRMPRWLEAGELAGALGDRDVGAAGLAQGLVFPLTAGDEAIGVVELYRRRALPLAPMLLSAAGLLGRDVGEFVARRQAEERLLFQKALLESQSESTRDGILVVSPEGRMISFNRRFVEMWGIPQEVVESRSDQAALRSVLDQVVDPESFLSRVSYLYEHPEESSSDELLLRDGRVVDRWSTPLRGEDGAYYGRAWYFQDITEHRRAQEVLQRSGRRAEILAQATNLLGAGLNHDALLRTAAQILACGLHGWCVIDVVDRPGHVRRIAATSGGGSPERLAAVLMTEPPGEGVQDLLDEEHRDDRARLLPSPPSPTLRSAVPEGLTGHPAIAVPLAARGRLLGVATLTSRRREGYGESDLQLTRELADRVALAADNARLYAERSLMARALQQGLLPPDLPRIPGLEVAAEFVSAGHGTDIGGDFYDLFPSGRGEWTAVIGDVSGKGPEAASVTALTRYTIRTAAMRIRRPSRILRILNQAIEESGPPERFCTVACVRLQPSAHGTTATISSAGHPLPLLRTPDGRVEAVGRGGIALGLAPDPALTDRRIVLPEGSTLLLYTDGVTEARHRGEILGEERLRTIMATGTGRPADLVTSVAREVVEFSGGATEDDMAALAIGVPHHR